MDSVANPPSSPATSQPDNIITQLVLSRLPQFGPASYWAAHRHLGAASQLLQTDVDINRLPLRSPTLKTLREIHQLSANHPLYKQAERDWLWLQENNITVLTHNDDRYPELLRTIEQAPPLLFVKGQLDNLYLPQLAMVGSRNPSPAGRENAEHFARTLSAMGFVITSGLARGIDGASHRGTLRHGGATIAVMATGIDKIYPASHKSLADEIVDKGGTLVTEFPLGTAPNASHFPRRNRIISGMSLGVLVVEAAVKSGSLITARYALEQNREVFAVPGSIHNPVSRGCHSLLRDGASLVESIDDLRESLQGLLQFKWTEVTKASSIPPPKPAPSLSRDEAFVLQQLGFDSTSTELLEQRTGLATGALLAALMSLELKGLVASATDGYQRLSVPEA